MTSLRVPLIGIIFWLSAALPSAAQSYWTPHWAARDAVISAQATLLAPYNKVMFVGDSNREMYWWNTTGSCLIENAGYAGVHINDMVSRAATLASYHPVRVDIMLGTNDLFTTTPADLAQMQTDLTSIVMAFKNLSIPVTLEPIPPFDSGYATLVARDAINGVIQTVAGNTGSYWDWYWVDTITQGTMVNGVVTSGYAISGAMNGDHVHLSSSSQLSVYNRMPAWNSLIGVCR